MKATIYRSGGIGGLRIGGTVETDQLNADLAARAAAALQPGTLGAAAAAPPAPGSADQYDYEVTLGSGDTYNLEGSGGTVAVLDELVNEIISRRRG